MERRATTANVLIEKKEMKAAFLLVPSSNKRNTKENKNSNNRISFFFHGLLDLIKILCLFVSRANSLSKWFMKK